MSWGQAVLQLQLSKLFMIDLPSSPLVFTENCKKILETEHTALTELAKTRREKEKLKRIIQDGVSLNAAIAILEGNTFEANIEIENSTKTKLGTIPPSGTLSLKNVPILFDNKAGVEKQIIAATISHIPANLAHLYKEHVSLVAQQGASVNITATIEYKLGCVIC